jgi:integrase
LADARIKAADARKLIATGVDPIQAKASTRQQKTFGELADELIASLSIGWKNEKHKKQWPSTLNSYAASLRPMNVADITTEHVMRVLNPIWAIKPETASRLRGRIEAVIDAATARDLRSDANPARWKGHLQSLLPPRKRLTRGHQRAMPYQDTPVFIALLKAQEGHSARALEFAIITAARSGEVLNSKWSEFDLENRIWIIPSNRMKAGKEHRVPLSDPAMQILKSLYDIRISDFVFPGRKSNQGLSVMALEMTLRRMKQNHMTTVHGFRSCFSDWATEQTHYSSEVREMALAHTVGNKVEAAYRRGDLFEKQRGIMIDWANFLHQATSNENVITISKARAE